MVSEDNEVKIFNEQRQNGLNRFLNYRSGRGRKCPDRINPKSFYAINHSSENVLPELNWSELFPQLSFRPPKKVSRLD